MLSVLFIYTLSLFFRASPQGRRQTYCPLCPPHRGQQMLRTPHITTTTTIITITAAIYLFVCYRQRWYSQHCCALCSYCVLLCVTTWTNSVVLLVHVCVLKMLCLCGGVVSNAEGGLYIWWLWAAVYVISSQSVTCLFSVHVTVLCCH